MRFPYQSYPVQGVGHIRIVSVDRPAVPIRVIGPIGDALAYGLVDTGADETMLPDRFVGPLGIVILPDDRATIVAFTLKPKKYPDHIPDSELEGELGSLLDSPR